MQIGSLITQSGFLIKQIFMLVANPANTVHAKKRIIARRFGDAATQKGINNLSDKWRFLIKQGMFMITQGDILIKQTGLLLSPSAGRSSRSLLCARIELNSPSLTLCLRLGLRISAIEKKS